MKMKTHGMQQLFAALMLAFGIASTALAAGPQAYAGVAASGTDHKGGAGKVNPKVFGGLAFGDSLAVEGGYIDLRKATAAPEARTIDLGGFGSYVAARLMRPFTEKLSAYGKLGVAHSQRKVSNVGVVGKDNDTGIYGAFGLQYSIAPGVAISAEYERYGKDKKTGAKADAWTLGINFAF